MQRIGVLYNPLSSVSVQTSLELVAHLQRLDLGLSVWRGTSQEKRDDVEAVASLDLLVALGGDGTVLRAARLAIPHNIPILTVALGRLNFMAELTPDTLYDGIATLLKGEGWLDRRTLLQATLTSQGRQTTLTALNEMVLSRGDSSRIVTVDVLIDRLPLTTYRADGVLVATATGSTAYALSAGGPIVDPRSRALVLVPVAAHLTAVPAMVLHEDSVVTLRLHACQQGILAVDGRENLPFKDGDEVQVCRSNRVCTFVRVHPPKQFYVSLIQRLRRE